MGGDGATPLLTSGGGGGDGGTRDTKVGRKGGTGRRMVRDGERRTAYGGSTTHYGERRTICLCRDVLAVTLRCFTSLHLLRRDAVLSRLPVFPLQTTCWCAMCIVIRTHQPATCVTGVTLNGKRRDGRDASRMSESPPCLPSLERISQMETEDRVGATPSPPPPCSRPRPAPAPAPTRAATFRRLRLPPCRHRLAVAAARLVVASKQPVFGKP